MSPGPNDYTTDLKGAPTPSDMKTVLNTFDGSHQSRDLNKSISQANRVETGSQNDYIDAKQPMGAIKNNSG